ncbi:mas-related G-protein coupled receptor member X3-like [Petaurus breviceps papuanus]|uniref:mas-related G-protein coupled receptor member X3-like n=1 Tax=Petaurus breviceps papuanus TaxID=3040969 RepID=UPI0036DD21F6
MMGKAFLGYLLLSVTTLGLLCVLGMAYIAGLSLLASISTHRCLTLLFPIWHGYHLAVIPTLLLRVQCSCQSQQPPRLYLLVLLMVLMFLLCGLPMGIRNSTVSKTNSDSVPFLLSGLLACVNSSSDPFIYFFLGSQRHKSRREPLRVVLQKALGG